MAHLRAGLVGVSLGTLEPGAWDRGCSPGSALGGQKCSKIQESHMSKAGLCEGRPRGQQPHPGQKGRIRIQFHTCPIARF